MKLTKYMHACVVLEEAGQSLVIDPGNFSDDFTVPQQLVAVVVTHLHPDHCDPDKLQAIIRQNPDTKVYALEEVARVAGVPVAPVQPGDELDVGGFHLEFVGGAHATIHTDIVAVGNVGVVVNRDLLYYPGDSFTPPPRHVRWIATPVSAPWLKVSEVVDFLRNAAPKQAFPTHDAILSDKGQALVDRVIPSLLGESIGYVRIRGGDTIEL